MVKLVGVFMCKTPFVLLTVYDNGKGRCAKVADLMDAPCLGES